MSELNRLSKRRVKRIGTRRGETPLAYALRVMRDPEADVLRRDRMCIAALPFCHARKAARYVGKAERAAQAAKAAGQNIEWAGDLRTEGNA
jgi:hypothetical protein